MCDHGDAGRSFPPEAFREIPFDVPERWACSSNGDRELLRPIVDNLLGSDPFLLLADYRSYIDCQNDVDRASRDVDRWTRASILNAARMGGFSSDRSIRDYCRDIWNVEPVSIGDSEDPD